MNLGKACVALVFAAFGTIALGGCKLKLDEAKLEQTIMDEAKKKDWKVKSVSCPKDREVKKDDKFKCTIKLEDGKEIDANVTQTDDKGTVSWEAQAPGASSAGASTGAPHSTAAPHPADTDE